MFSLALEWELGVLDHCSVLRPAPLRIPAQEVQPDRFDDGYVQRRAVANGEAIIGVAKGVFGDDLEQAAMIGGDDRATGVWPEILTRTTG